jgi:hypothetical protein
VTPRHLTLLEINPPILFIPPIVITISQLSAITIMPDVPCSLTAVVSGSLRRSALLHRLLACHSTLGSKLCQLFEIELVYNVTCQANSIHHSHEQFSRHCSRETNLCVKGRACLMGFYGMLPVMYLLDNIYVSVGQCTQQLLQ